MFFEKWTERLAKNAKWYDFSLFEMSVFSGTMLLLTIWPDFRRIALSIDWYIYLIVFIIATIPLLKKMFSD